MFLFDTKNLRDLNRFYLFYRLHLLEQQMIGASKIHG